MGIRFSFRIVRNRIVVRRTRNTRAEKGLHARRLSSLRRRDPECEGDHRLPAAAESQPQRSLPGGIRAAGGIAHRFYGNGYEAAYDERRQDASNTLGIEVPGGCRRVGAESNAVSVDNKEKKDANGAALEDSDRRGMAFDDPEYREAAEAIDRLGHFVDIGGIHDKTQ
jgi:hypothetical protein